MTIELIGMEFYACIGCLDFEKVMPNCFLVDFRGELNNPLAGKDDNLSSTIDYGQIYDLIKREMAQPCNLIEGLAHRICKEIKKNFGSELREFSLSIAKKNPPVAGKVEYSKITVNVR